MVRILICDDNEIFARSLERDIADAFTVYDRRVQTSVFLSAAEAIEALKLEGYDLLLIDLVLDDADGYALADTIRHSGNTAEIAFITNYPERMQGAFAFRPIGFFPKPQTKEALRSLVERYLFYHDGDHTYRIESRYGITMIPVHRIDHLESCGHRVTVMCNDGRTPVIHTGRLDEAEAQLRVHGFIRIHQSFLVNPRSIVKIDRQTMTVVLTNGRQLHVSRQYYPDLIQKYVRTKLR